MILGEKTLSSADVANGLERRDEDGGKLEVFRLAVGGNLIEYGDGSTRAAAPAGEVDMGDGLEDDEEDGLLSFEYCCGFDRGHEALASTLSRSELVGDLELGRNISKIGSIVS